MDADEPGERNCRVVIDAQVAIDLAFNGATIPPHTAWRPPRYCVRRHSPWYTNRCTAARSTNAPDEKVLDDIRGLRIRLLGDQSLQDHAWRIAATLNWPDTYQAEYIAPTQLQADALATADHELSAAARTFVHTVSPADILLP